MPKIRIILATLLSLVAARGDAAAEPDTRHIIGDFCATYAYAAFPSAHAYHLHNGATIIFIAVAHTADARSLAAKAAILKSIGDGFDAYKPDMVLVEGASSARSNDGQYLTFLSDTARRQFSTGEISENLYAIKLASDRHIRFSGWDMSPHDEYLTDIAAGFEVRDVIGAHLLRARLNPLQGTAETALQRELNAIPHVRQPDSFDFASWYRAIYGNTYDSKAGTPCGTGIASRIVKNESVHRTLNIVTLLDTFATPGKVVLVEAGGGHWLALKDYLASISQTTL